MSRSVRWLLAGIFLVAVLGTILYRELLGPPDVVWRSEIRKGNQLIAEIEAFQRERGRLPAELSEITNYAAAQDRLSYLRCGETRYIVWFGTTLGESMTYDSQSRNWTDMNVVCP